ncbi:MAG: hypothetical protein MHM6MM_008513, partial [Cercozoa sp. M6MM]
VTRQVIVRSRSKNAEISRVFDSLFDEHGCDPSALHKEAVTHTFKGRQYSLPLLVWAVAVPASAEEKSQRHAVVQELLRRGSSPWSAASLFDSAPLVVQSDMRDKDCTVYDYTQKMPVVCHVAMPTTAVETIDSATYLTLLEAMYSDTYLQEHKPVGEHLVWSGTLHRLMRFPVDDSGLLSRVLSHPRVGLAAGSGVERLELLNAKVFECLCGFGPSRFRQHILRFGREISANQVNNARLLLEAGCRYGREHRRYLGLLVMHASDLKVAADLASDLIRGGVPLPEMSTERDAAFKSQIQLDEAHSRCVDFLDVTVSDIRAERVNVAKILTEPAFDMPSDMVVEVLSCLCNNDTVDGMSRKHAYALVHESMHRQSVE